MKKSRKITLFILTILSVVSIASYPIYAWFSGGSKFTQVGDIEINIPPLIYIRDDDLEEMTSFDLDGLQVKTEYNFIFCVSPVKKNVVETFILGVIYTENIGMKIDIYPVTSIGYTQTSECEMREIEDNVKGTGTKNVYFTYNSSNKNWATRQAVTYGNGMEPENYDPNYQKENLNRGIHKTYYGEKFTKTASNWNNYDSLLDALQDKSRYAFYNLQITWDDDVSIDTNKEVDIVYVTTKGASSES